MSVLSTFIDWATSEWITVFALLFAVYVAKFYYQYFTRENPLPGPTPVPIFGNMLSAARHLPNWAKKTQAEYGDIWELWLGSQRFIFLSRADLVEKIYAPSTKNNYTMRTAPDEGLDEFGFSTKGIIMNRLSWQYNRQFVNQSLTTPKYLKEFVACTQKSFKETEELWRKLANSGRPLDFAAWAMRLVTDVTVVMATGKPAYQCAVYYNRLAPRDKVSHPPSVFKSEGDFVTSITTWFYAVQFSYFFPRFVRHNFPIFSHFQNKYMKNSQWLSSTLMGIIAERKKEIEATPIGEPLTADILTLLLTTNTERDMAKINTKRQDRPMTDEEIVENLVEVFAAGIDTTANSLTFMIYNMCKNPHVKAKLIRELDTVFGQGSLPEKISIEDLDKLEYCDAFIKETARLTPVVPLLVKMATNDDTVVGLKWKAGTMFYTYVHGIHMHDKHWEDPEEFRPERFLKGKDGQDPTVRNSLLQFGGGLRVCPGRQMAMYELKTVMCLLLRRWDIELCDKKSELKHSFGMINHCDNLDVWMQPKSH